MCARECTYTYTVYTQLSQTKYTYTVVHTQYVYTAVLLTRCTFRIPFPGSGPVIPCLAISNIENCRLAFRNWQQGEHGIGRAVAAIDQPFNATLCACAWDLCTPELNSNPQLRDSRVGMWQPPPSRSHAHLAVNFWITCLYFSIFYLRRSRACDLKCAVPTQYSYIVCIHSCTCSCGYTVVAHARCTYTYTYNVHIHSCRYTVYMRNCHILHRIQKRMSRTFIWLS